MWLNGDLLGSQNNFHRQFSWRVTFISSAILIFHIRLPVYSLDLWEVCSGRGRGGLGGNWLEMLKMASETCFPLDYADFSQLLHSFLRIIISGWKNHIIYQNINYPETLTGNSICSYCQQEDKTNMHEIFKLYHKKNLLFNEHRLPMCK